MYKLESNTADIQKVVSIFKFNHTWKTTQESAGKEKYLNQLKELWKTYQRVHDRHEEGPVVFAGANERLTNVSTTSTKKGS